MKVTFTELKKVVFEHVEIREATIQENIKAEQLAETSSGLKYTCALLSICATFDGKKLLMEDLLAMPQSFFLELQAAQMGISLEELMKLTKEQELKESKR